MKNFLKNFQGVKKFYCIKNIKKAACNKQTNQAKELIFGVKKSTKRKLNRGTNKEKTLIAKNAVKMYLQFVFRRTRFLGY